MTGSRVSPREWLVFTDLDGSLLDHDSYDWSPAADWLRRLREAGTPVIPVSGKTRAELLPLRRELALEATPFIAENGAVIGLPSNWQHARLDRDPQDIGGLSIKTPGVDSAFLRSRLTVLRERLGLHFRLMSELSVAAVVEATGLSEVGAEHTRLREGSEPLLWDDDEAALARLHQALANDGLMMTRDGRFWHVMGDVDKGRSLRWLVARYQALRGVTPDTLGLGDGPNDVPLLEAVEAPVLIRGVHRQPVAVRHAALYRTRETGPRGWAEGLDYWLGACGPAPPAPLEEASS